MGAQIKPSVRRKVEARDKYCVHCGEINDLVVHHRRNRQMGGTKGKQAEETNGVQNLLRVCNEYNFLMESNASVAAAASGWGHKLRSWEKVDKPVWDSVAFAWYFLNADGERVEVVFDNENF